MIDGHHLKAVLFEPLPVLTRDLEVGLDDAHGRDASETDNNLGPQQRDLTAKIADAGVLLHAELEADDLKHVVEQMTGPADEWHALRILVRAGAFADE